MIEKAFATLPWRANDRIGLCRFGSDGYIDITISKFNSWHQGSIDLSEIGLFVTTAEAEAQLEVELAQVILMPPCHPQTLQMRDFEIKTHLVGNCADTGRHACRGNAPSKRTMS